MSRAMTIGELIRVLQVLDEDIEIRMACQPNWPFEYSIAGVTTKSRYWAEEDPPDIAFIVEGEQLQYGDKQTFDREYRICV